MSKSFIVVVFSCFASICFAQKTVTVSGVKYSLNNGEATIIKQATTLTGDIVIPDKVTDDGTYDVVSIADSAFCQSNITSITLPNSIKSMGNDCLSSCKNLTTAILPESLTSIGNNCFKYSSSLTNVTLPKQLVSLGKYSFYLCENLTSIDLPKSITSVGKECFNGCSALTRITLPSNITTLGEGCFNNLAN